jgi:hypothetical protein
LGRAASSALPGILLPAKQREWAARLGVEPVELGSDQTVFTLRPRDLARLHVGSAN